MKEGDIVVLLGADPTIAGAWAFRPVTAADLEGEKVWSCYDTRKFYDRERSLCQGDSLGCGWRLLIPIPDEQPAMEGT